MDRRTADLEHRAIFEEWSRLRGKVARSLERAAALADALELEKKLRSVAVLGVVGSKGKGTAAIYASATAAAGGHTVGTITSPGVTDNIDRVRIDGRILDPVVYREMLETVLAARRKLPRARPDTGYLSPSGLYLLAGLRTLVDRGCDVVVAEAGIGGKSDELSLLDLDAVLLTQVFSEHTEVLGPTLIDIARDKLGVVSARTKCVISLPQVEVVRREVETAVARVDAELIWIDPGADSDSFDFYPPGFSRRNAVAGVRAGVELCSIIDGQEIDRTVLERTLKTVNYPGRLSEHTYGDATVIIDSAISRDGLVSALIFARSRFGKIPDKILVSVPSNKDFDGFVHELGGVEAARYFVNMRGSHLPYPDRTEWPWEWIDDDALPEVLRTGTVLVVGTVTYSGAVLRIIGADTAEVFTPRR
ncbi:hypothetical protein [Nocardia arizonensis]|uniref:hypothetical protein n=1 Tax=Nocardia arizonensis TaxID=1141647 RepID=UPI0006D01CB0|nr:hypothetical protein [Nocardia arizonensis]